jgi:hypothetical protein
MREADRKRLNKKREANSKIVQTIAWQDQPFALASGAVAQRRKRCFLPEYIYF